MNEPIENVASEHANEQINMPVNAVKPGSEHANDSYNDIPSPAHELCKLISPAAVGSNFHTTPNRTCSLWRNAYSSQACNLLLSSCHTKTSHQNRLPNRTCSLWRFCLLKSISLFIEKHIRWGTRACHKAQSCNKQNSLSQWIHPTRTEHVLFSIDELAATTICARDCFCI